MDPYVYPGTNVLRNLRGVRDPAEASEFEARATALRMSQLDLVPVPGDFDAAHLRAVHRHIFQDVYDWAGQFRTVSLAKLEFDGGPLYHFLEPRLIESHLDTLLDRLRRQDHLRGLPRPAFADAAAAVMAGINRAHPFREGNGRTQRLFVEALARHAGYTLRFDAISRERMIDASIRAAKGEAGAMSRIFREVSDPEAVAALRRAIQFLESQKFPWNAHYLAMTTPGESYEGKLAGRDGAHFMMRDTRKQRILIGYARDLPPGAQSGDNVKFTAAEAGLSGERSGGG